MAKMTAVEMTRVTISEIASVCEAPNQPRMVPTAVVLKKVTKAAAVSAAPNPMASSRSRPITQTKKVWSSGWSARVRNAMRSDPTAPMAAPMRPTRARTPVMLRVSGWIEVGRVDERVLADQAGNGGVDRRRRWRPSRRD